MDCTIKSYVERLGTLALAAELKNNITLGHEGSKIEITPDGFAYNGKTITDAGRIYRTMMAVMHGQEPNELEGGPADIRLFADLLIEEAKAAGQVVTINTVPRHPPAMGNYDMVAEVRPKVYEPKPEYILFMRPTPSVDVDSIALETAIRILAIDYSALPGEDTQYKAMIQCMVRDAIEGYTKQLRTVLATAEDMLAMRDAKIGELESVQALLQKRRAALDEGRDADSLLISNMALLIARLSRQLIKAVPEHQLPHKATEFLKRHNLIGSPLREQGNESDDANDGVNIDTVHIHRDQYTIGMDLGAGDDRTVKADIDEQGRVIGMRDLEGAKDEQSNPKGVMITGAVWPDPAKTNFSLDRQCPFNRAVRDKPIRRELGDLQDEQDDKANR